MYIRLSMIKYGHLDETYSAKGSDGLQKNRHKKLYIIFTSHSEHTQAGDSNICKVLAYASGLNRPSCSTSTELLTLLQSLCYVLLNL